WYSFTDFEPDDARGAFPCFDEPSFKIPWHVTVRAPAGDLVVTNTPVERDSLVDGGLRETIFHRTPPLPSYLVAIAVGPFDTVGIPGLAVPGRVVTVKGRGPQAAEAARTTGPILAAEEAWFGSRYPFEKLDLIAVPEFWAGAMENPGAITYRESVLLHDP